jgi:dolichol-phosphate mannosyltransferase
MKISVLIPTKNEPVINDLIKNIHLVLRKFNHEIIVIDKSDITPNIKDAKLVIQKTDGLGKAVLEGLSHTKGDVIVTMDGDFSHEPRDLLKLIEKVGRYDIVIGSRFVSGGINEDEIHRKIISFLFRKFASFILGLSIEDSMSGFIAVKRHVYENLYFNPIGYKINTEIMFKSKKKNYKICEVPIIFHKRKAGKTKAGISSLGLKEGLNIIRYVFELRLGLR